MGRSQLFYRVLTDFVAGNVSTLAVVSSAADSGVCNGATIIVSKSGHGEWYFINLMTLDSNPIPQVLSWLRGWRRNILPRNNDDRRKCEMPRETRAELPTGAQPQTRDQPDLRLHSDTDDCHAAALQMGDNAEVNTEK